MITVIIKEPSAITCTHFEFLLAEKNYPQARYHFIHSSDGEGCARFLIEYHITAGFPSEVDLFIAQAVLQLSKLVYMY